MILKLIAISRLQTAVLVALSLVSATPELEAQWYPISAVERRRLDYVRGNGERVSDSVLSVRGDTMLVRRVVFSTSGSRTSEQRRFLRTTAGVELVSAAGDQLLYPQPWPTTRTWTYRFGSTTYQYSLIGDTTWTVNGSSTRAWKIQLLREGLGQPTLLRLVLAEGVGFVHQRREDQRGAADDSLVQVVDHTPPTARRPTAPKRDINWRALGWLLPSPYVGGFVGAATHGSDEAPADNSYRDSFYAGGGVEAGLHHIVGARLRYARLIPFDSSGKSNRSLGMKSLDMLLSTSRLNQRRALFAGIGYTQIGTDSTRKWLGTPNALMVGGRSGGSHVSWTVEASYLRDVLEKPLLLPVNGTPTTQRGDLFVLAFGFRWF